MPPALAPKKPKEETERENPWLKTVWERTKKVAKVAKAIAGIGLLPFAIVSSTGCAPHEMPTVSLGCDSNLKIGENAVWAPAYIGKKTGMSMGANSIVIKVPYEGNLIPGSSNLPEGVSKDIQRKGERIIVRALFFADELFKPEVFKSIVDDNIFVIMKSPDSQSAGEYLRMDGYRLANDKKGQLVACCIESCPEYDFSKDEKEHDFIRMDWDNWNDQTFEEASQAAQESAAYTKMDTRVFHELLHDAWYTYLTGTERNGFAERAYIYWDVLGNDWRTDQLFAALWSGRYYDEDKVKHSTGGGGLYLNIEDSLNRWVSERRGLFSGMSNEKIEETKEAIRSYLFSRSVLAHGSSSVGLGGILNVDRDFFIVVEGFAYMGHISADHTMLGNNPQGMLPAFMRPSYGRILKAEELDKMTNNNPYFSSIQSFERLIPYIEDFVIWTAPSQGINVDNFLND